MTLHWIDKMAVEVDGEGDPVVMVHGLGGTTNTWTPLLPALTNAKRIRIELPGSGRSHRAHLLQDNTPNKGLLSIDTLVDAVLRVCAQLGMSRAHFAGHSMGTIVCQHLAVRAPERVRSLALFGALLAPPEPARQGLKTRAAKARDEGMFGIADAIVQACAFELDARAAAGGGRLRARVVARAGPRRLCANCEALAAAQPAAIEGIDVPTLLVAGDEDAIASVQVARDIERRISDAQVEVLSRCGHWMTAERATECQSHLRGFWSALAGERRTSRRQHGQCLIHQRAHLSMAAVINRMQAKCWCKAIASGVSRATGSSACVRCRCRLPPERR